MSLDIFFNAKVKCKIFFGLMSSISSNKMKGQTEDLKRSKQTLNKDAIWNVIENDRSIENLSLSTSG